MAEGDDDKLVRNVVASIVKAIEKAGLMQLGRLLIVAGSDSGGGAGIQADIKTASALGVYAMTAVTAVTVQDTMGVHAIHAVPPETIAHQMRVCLADIGADAIKTGMLASEDMIVAVAAALRDHARDVPLVVDPVMVAKGGARLIDDGALNVLKRDMLPLATVLTPNAPEASALAGGAPVETVEDMIAVGRMLRTLGPHAVLMKGGHVGGTGDRRRADRRDGRGSLCHPRIATVHTHGTGCTLASAIASGLAQGLSLHTAVERARAYVLEAIPTAPGFGHGHGPLNHMHGGVA